MTCNKRSKILECDRPVPRYTSYPAAPHFMELEDPDNYKTWLQAVPDQSTLSLYFHIPYCSQLCWYCGCNTQITQKYSPVQNYLELMKREIEMIAEQLSDTQKVTHIHFGGGSPTIIESSDFMHLMKLVRQNFTFDADAKIAMEIDPRGVTEERVAAYAAQGINRVSLGIQDFNSIVLKAINRPQPYHIVEHVVQLFRKYGVEDINFDLIYGLPYQDLQTAVDTFDKTLALSPARIAYFGYAHVPWKKKHMRMIQNDILPNTATRYDLFQYGAKRLEDAGYVPIGIDHFAKPDNELAIAAANKELRRNFQGYTSDKADILIGIGVSSIGDIGHKYIQNTADMSVYREKIQQGELPVHKFYLQTGDDMLRGAVIEQLMCYFTADIPSLCQAYGFSKTYLDKECQALAEFEGKGFLKISQKGVIVIDPALKNMVRILSSVFDTHLTPISTQPRHSTSI